MKSTILWCVPLTLLAIGGCVDRNAQVQAKRTAEVLNDKTVRVEAKPAVEMPISESLEITGQLVAGDDAQIGAKVAGRLVAVYIVDGSIVSAGQVIAQQETANQIAQLRQAQGQLAGAQAQLAQAISNSRLNPKRTSSAVALAEAGLRSAKAQLAKARRGARSEDVRQAEIQVGAARFAMETAKKERDRKLNLFNEGAASRQQYEVAENAYQQALSQYESSLEVLRMRQSQTEPEDLRTAEEAVRQAEENLRTARAQKELDVTLIQQVSAARAQVQTAQAGVDLARQNLADATIRSPFSGRVSGKPLQVGAVLAPGTPVARLIGADGIYFEGQVPEKQVASILPGKQVTVRFDALPGRTFQGTIATVNPQGSSVGRQFSVRITLQNPPEEAKAGMFARGDITLRTIDQAVMVPKTAVLGEGGESHVFVLIGDSAAKRSVVRGVERGELVQVENLKAGELVITKGQNSVKDGDKVKRGEAPNEPKKSAVESSSAEAEG